MDDYDYDDFDLDDGWLYAEDEFDLADELAENQIAEPGYSGTNFEIAMDSYEFELFAFWDDLEYADDSYFDYGRLSEDSNPAGIKRKREEAENNGVQDKRRKMQVDIAREDDPLLLVSRAERLRSFFEPPPLLEKAVKYTFLANWRERFADVDGLVENKAMPVDMKRAAEAEAVEAEEKDIDEENTQEAEEEGDWEEEDQEGGEDDEDEDEPSLDPKMLKEVLKQKLDEAGLGGENEAAFMQVIARMMSGEGDADDAAGDLATSLLGKLNSENGGDSALSGWLSQQGVALEGGEDEDASSVATVEIKEGPRHSGLSTRQSAQDSPIDSVVGEAQKRNSNQMPLHPGSPTASSNKKRTVTEMGENEKPSKKQKKVTFDVLASSPLEPSAQILASEGAANLPTSGDALMSKSTPKERPIRSRSTTNAKSNDDAGGKAAGNVAEKTNAKNTRKRKAAAAEVTEEKPPEKKKKGKKEVDGLEDAVAASPMGPPARRTRAAKAKAEK